MRLQLRLRIPAHFDEKKSRCVAKTMTLPTKKRMTKKEAKSSKNNRQLMLLLS